MCFRGFAHYVWYWKKNIQFGILVFLEAQEKNWEAIWDAANVMNIVYFHDNFFRFTKKFLPLLTL